jgi:hypothetical protein
VPEEAMGLIQGLVPDSAEEWRVSLSLDKYGWEYIYQASVNGGRNMRGGQVIDFLVETAPKQTALYIQGEYWHGSKQENKDELLQAYAFGPLQLLVEILTGDQLETQEESDAAVLELFGRNS